MNDLHTKSLIEKATAVFALLLGAMSAALAQNVGPTYQVVDLGTLAGGDSSYAQAINSNGQVVGRSAISGAEHAFLWSNGSMQDLGLLDGYGQGTATAVNDAGQVVGYESSDGSTPIRAFLYSNGSLQDLGGSAAWGINNSGQTAGYANVGSQHAVLWSGTSMQDLGTFGGSSSAAYDINDSGQVSGNYVTNGAQHSFLYTTGSIRDLGTLGGLNSATERMNNNGQVVGFSDTATTGVDHAFLYSGGSLRDLGVLGGNNSAGFGINNNGMVVGATTTGTGDTHAFLYTNNSMLDLNELIISNSGWTLIYATAINNAGQIVGYGLNQAGQYHAFRLDPQVSGAIQSPNILNQPTSQYIQAGESATFGVVANGQQPLSYQWQFNGSPLSGATGSTLTLNSVTAGNSGGYSVVVSNPYGSVTSATASLAVLADGANGNTPVQTTAAPLPSKPTGVTKLVLITHGWEPEGPAADLSWMNEMQDAIIKQITSSDCFVTPYYWVGSTPGQGAWTVTPQQALNHAKILGTQLGRQIGNSFQNVHLIGHSAGAGLIQAAADAIRQASPTTLIQITFLDPFVGFDYSGLSGYGANANWSDDYFTPVDSDTSAFGDTTGLPLPKAYAVDVSWVGPYDPVWYVGPGGGEVAVSSHGYPIDFYEQTITSTDSSWCGTGYGFSLSMEMEGASWINNITSEPIGSSPVPPCSPPDAVQNPNLGLGELESIAVGGAFLLRDADYEVVSTGATFVGEAGFELQSIWSSLPFVKSGGGHPLGSPIPEGGPANTDTPAWLAVGVSVTNAANLVQFDAAFTDTNSAQGLLTVYWNTNQIGMVDERVAETNLQTYRFELPGTVTNGLYTLSFRLDSFDNSSTIAVTNVATGFVGLTQPITLGLSITNGAPLLQLTAPTNFTYLIQRSTNLVDWTSAALLLNTNGTVLFADPMATNSSARFYRAVIP